MINTTSIQIIENTQFKSLVNKLTSMPLWVKQAIYQKLKKNLQETSDLEYLNNLDFRLVQLFIPKLTMAGTRLIHQKSATLSNQNLKHLQMDVLKDCYNKLNLLEIAHKRGISFRECCQIVLDLINLDYIEQIYPKESKNLVEYFSGRLSLGEYLVKAELVSRAQLDRVLYTQRCTLALDEEITLEDALLNLGYIDGRLLHNIKEMFISGGTAIEVLDESELQAEESIMLKDQLDMITYKSIRLERELEFYKKRFEDKRLETLELSKQLTKYNKGFMNKIFTSFS